MMPSLEPVLRGFLIGLSVAAPVGPIGVLCIRRTITYGRASGFVSGLGAATADTIYGIVAALGITALAPYLEAGRIWIAVVGGAIVIWFGISTLRAKPSESAADRPHTSLLRDYLSVLGLTITNPMTIVFFAGVLAGFSRGARPLDRAGSFLLVGGVFVGSALWWFALSFLAGLIPFGPKVRRIINVVCGVVLLGFGVWMPLSILLKRG